MDHKEWQGHNGPVMDTVRGFDVIDCASCGFRHIIPIPTPEELENVYREEYYSIEKPLYIERYREDLEWWNLVYTERYQTLERLLPGDRRSIMDVGSGPGFFLLNGKNRGWLTLGIEPSSQSATHSRGIGLEIVEDFLSDRIAADLGCFDVIHSSQVLEHIPDPTGMLRLMHRIITPGGLVCVVVPNDYNPFQEALRSSCGYAPWWVAPPHHINYFDFRSLASLLERCGFDVIHKETTFPIDLFLLMGENYIGNDALGRACHGWRKTLEQNIAAAGLGEIKQSLYQSLADLGLGREVVLVGRKNR